MKRHLTLFIFLLMLSPLFAEQFEKYDFTFYETVDDSVAVMNEERLGFDYTGYGFLGEKMTTGLYVRFGMQTPYSTLINIFDKKEPENSESVVITPTPPEEGAGAILDNAAMVENNKLSTEKTPIASNTATIDSTDSKENLAAKYEKEFIFSFTIGPAFRHFISPTVMWYMGMGVTSIIKDTTANTSNKDELLTNFEMKLGTDVDMGFRLDLQDTTSLRIGIHITTDILTYSSSTLSGGEIKKPTTTNIFTADIFTPVGEKSSTEATGYIGLAHVFKPKDVTRYRYSNKTKKLGGGTLQEMPL